MRLAGLFLFALCASACSDSPAKPACSDGEACTCEPGTLLGCNGDNASYCNAAGNGAEDRTCSQGCDAQSGCVGQVCEPGASVCSADGTAIEHCSLDGMSKTTEACALGCGSDAQRPAYCKALAPAYFETLCDTPATGPDVVHVNAMLDTSNAGTCNGGLLGQTAGRPALCVVRHPKIALTGQVTVTGPHAIAFVADALLEVTGTLDVSANADKNGPGGGTIISGTAGSGTATTSTGAGGAGFRHDGGDGGGATNTVSGGPPLAPTPAATGFIGGPRPEASTNTAYPLPGGGGGALLLVACRGAVTVSGTIDAGGGGGGGSSNADYYPGAGGGAGGFVVIQGGTVSITGSLFANGGGGGAGCGTPCDVGGTPGQDGQRSTTAATGGTNEGGAGDGGTGGTATPPGGGGGALMSAIGGGGGAAGRFHIYTPAGVSPTVTPAMVSPTIDPHLTVETK